MKQFGNAIFTTASCIYQETKNPSIILSLWNKRSMETKLHEIRSLALMPTAIRKVNEGTENTSNTIYMVFTHGGLQNIF